MLEIPKRIFSVLNFSFKETPNELAILYSRRRSYIQYNLKKKCLQGKKCFKLDCSGHYMMVRVCQNSEMYTKRSEFSCKWIIQRRKKIGAGYLLKCIKTTFSKLFQPKQGTWVPNMNVKLHKTNTL